MDKSYLLVISLKIDPLLKYERYHPYAVAIMTWLIPQLYQELGDKLKDIEIEIIKFQMFGAYPILGLHHAEQAPSFELAQLVGETCDRLISERPISEIILAITKDGVNWDEITKEIMR